MLYSNVAYILVFLTVELCFVFDAASYFALADGKAALSKRLMTTAGVFGFLAGLTGFYTVAHYLCEESLPFPVPMGDTSRFFRKKQQQHAVKNSGGDYEV